MNSEPDRPRSLREMERAVEAEGREWMRRRLEAELQAEANRHGGVFPPQRTQSPPSAAGNHAPAHRLRPGGSAGVARKRDPADGHWGCPLRERWGLSAHQQLSPALADRLAYFGTVAASYEAAAKLAAKLGGPVEDTTIRALVQRLGAKAEAQVQARLKEPPAEKEPERAATALAVLMLDGFQVRFRGPGWGKRKPAQPRVEWHEMKLGVFYRHEHAARGKRGQLAEKVMVGWQGEGVELGRRLHWEAQRGGLGRARAVLTLGDGAPWVWNVMSDRWAGAHQLLDFYHASEHLWTLGEALHPHDDAARLAGRGWKRACIGCGAERRRRCWRKWRRCPAAGVGGEKSSGANKTIGSFLVERV